MGELLTASELDAEPARPEPLVIEELPVRFWALAFAMMLSVNGLVVAVGHWRGSESLDWSRLADPLIGLTIGALLSEAVRAAFGSRRRIAVGNGYVRGPGRWWRHVRFPLRELDRARLAAELARPWRRPFGFQLRSTGGERIWVDSMCFGRSDRELLLRTLGVAPGART